MSQNRSGLDLSIPKILAGALAAASAAVASSVLGVAGTVLGAVVVSLVASVGTSLYTSSIERSSQLVRQTLPPLARPGETQRLQVADAESETATGTISSDDDPVPQVRPSADVRRKRLRWAGVAVTAVAMLVVGFGLLTAFEAVVGKSAAELAGRGDGTTTIGRIVSTEDRPSPDQDPQGETPTRDSGGTETPSESEQSNSTDPSAPQGTEPTEPSEPTETTAPTEPTETTEPTEPTEPDPTETDAPETTAPADPAKPEPTDADPAAQELVTPEPSA